MLPPAKSAHTGLMGLVGILLALSLAACSTAPPEGVRVVTPFDLARYQGTWFEIARLDHSFERGLSDVNARYQSRPDGSVDVINRGYDPDDGEWRQANGRAYFTGDRQHASLRVSFFWPFYGGYNVVLLDPDYRWSVVMGPSRDYLWILSRDKQLSPELRQKLLTEIAKQGVDTGKLIWVSHSRNDS
jgi:apolipoprotein D and lipocalin family protein